MMAKGVRRLRGNAALGVRDFLFGLAVFWGLMFAVCWAQGPAHAVNLPKSQMAAATDANTPAGTGSSMIRDVRTYAAAAERPIPRFEATASAPAFLMLGFMFALLTTLNLAFARHLHRTYAKPRTGAKTRRFGEH